MVREQTEHIKENEAFAWDGNHSNHLEAAAVTAVSSSPHQEQGNCSDSSAEQLISRGNNLCQNIKRSLELALKGRRKWRGSWISSPASSQTDLQSASLLNRHWHSLSSPIIRNLWSLQLCLMQIYVWRVQSSLWVWAVTGSAHLVVISLSASELLACTWVFFVTFSQPPRGLKTGKEGNEFLS